MRNLGYAVKAKSKADHIIEIVSMFNVDVCVDGEGRLCGGVLLYDNHFHFALHSVGYFNALYVQQMKGGQTKGCLSGEYYR